MKIGIMGTGMVAQTVGGKLLSLGHDVTFGTRDVAGTLSRTKPDGFGNPPFGVWKEGQPKAKLGTFREAAIFGELLINATSGTGSLPALQAAGGENLKGKILIDIANPLDFSKGFPPSLTVCNTDSLGEQIQRAFPDMKVIKTLNTMSAYVMINPAAVPGDHTLFLSGNDTDAKQQVASFLTASFGWKAGTIIDLGDITSARGTEMVLPLWVRLFSTLQNPMLNFHIAIGPKPAQRG